MEKEIDLNEVVIYTDIKFSNDDTTVLLKNVDLEMLASLNNKVKILEEILYTQWYLFGLYDVINIMGYNFIMVSKTKTKVELVKSN